MAPAHCASFLSEKKMKKSRRDFCVCQPKLQQHTYRVEFNCADLVNSMLSKSPSSSLNFDAFSNRFIHAAKRGGIVAK